MANVSSSNGLEKRPKLRFPGFDEPYKQCRIGDIYAERSQRGASNTELLSVTMNDGVKPRSEIEGKDNSSEDKSNYKIVRKGDMVYNSMRMWQGANGISPCDGIVSPAYTVLMPKQEINKGYFAALFKSANLINEFRKNSQGMTSDTWNLKYPQIETIKIQIPSVSEQDKVSELFGVLDARIVAQAQLIEALKKYKRGVMRAIFRDKSFVFSKATVWKSIRLGDECVFFSGGTPKSTDSSYYGGSIPFIRSGEIHGEKTELFLTEAGLQNSSAKMVSKGDLLIALYGATSGEVDISKIDGAINQAILCIRPYDMSKQYLRYLLEDSKDDIINTYLQGGQGNLSAEIIKNLRVDIPDSTAQSSVVEFLSMIERRIEMSIAECEQIQAMKRSSLQQLFI